MVLLLLAAAGTAFGQTNQPAAPQFPEPSAPRYELKLTGDEFAMLQSAVQNGLAKYGGDAAFYLRAQKINDAPVWSLTIMNSSLMQSWGFWLSEKMADMVGSADLDKLDEHTKQDLRAAKSAKDKLDSCRANPTYDPISKAGEIQAKDGGFALKVDQLAYELTGDKTAGLKDFAGKPTVITGYMKVKGKIEVIRSNPQTKNELNLFVMSLCPFGKRAENALVDFLAKSTAPESDRPKINLRFIFYKKVDNGKTVYTSLHGENEIKENLVQMVIRDRYPKSLWSYLAKRNASETPWDQLAATVGLDRAAIEDIQARIAKDRDSMISNEFAFAESLGVLDGSPTWIWEGMQTWDVTQVPAFKGMVLSTNKCQGV